MRMPRNRADIEQFDRFLRAEMWQLADMYIPGFTFTVKGGVYEQFAELIAVLDFIGNWGDQFNVSKAVTMAEKTLLGRSRQTRSIRVLLSLKIQPGA